MNLSASPCLARIRCSAVPGRKQSSDVDMVPGLRDPMYASILSDALLEEARLVTLKHVSLEITVNVPNVETKSGCNVLVAVINLKRVGHCLRGMFG